MVQLFVWKTGVVEWNGEKHELSGYAQIPEWMMELHVVYEEIVMLSQGMLANISLAKEKAEKG